MGHGVIMNANGNANISASRYLQRCWVFWKPECCAGCAVPPRGSGTEVALEIGWLMFDWNGRIDPIALAHGEHSLRRTPK